MQPEIDVEDLPRAFVVPIFVNLRSTASSNQIHVKRFYVNRFKGRRTVFVPMKSADKQESC